MVTDGDVSEGVFLSFYHEAKKRIDGMDVGRIKN